MKSLLLTLSLFSSALPAFADVSVVPPNACSLRASVFSNTAFTTEAAAEANCDALEAQTDIVDSCYARYRSSDDRWVAAFYYERSFDPNLLGTLTGSLQSFLTEHRVLLNAVETSPLKVRVEAVGTNCQ